LVKNFRDKIIDATDATVGHRAVHGFAETLKEHEFVWMGHKDTPDETFNRRGHRLPNSPF
jgi:hypothetical protein